MNDMESGQFRYSDVGGLTRFTRNVDFALPFESNNFSIAGMAGSNNYDFRAGNMQAGNYAAVAAANRNYTLRGMYTYASGFNKKQPIIRHMGKPHRALYTGCLYGRGLLVSQQLSVQSLVGLPERTAQKLQNH